MDTLTFIAEMNKAWAWPLTVLIIAIALFRMLIALRR